MPDVSYFNTSQQEQSIDWLYEDGGFNPTTVMNCSVLAVTNEDVDKWNTTIQQRNLSQPDPTILYSHDKMADVDDPKDILRKCLPRYVLNDFSNPAVAPNHELHLKVRNN